MAPIITIVLMVGIMTALGVAAALWGVDSRPSYRDDHARYRRPTNARPLTGEPRHEPVWTISRSNPSAGTAR
jgi:hypothetical protein